MGRGEYFYLNRFLKFGRLFFYVFMLNGLLEDLNFIKC